MKLTASTKNLSLLYSSKHIIPPVAARYMGSPVHPIAPKVAHSWEGRDRDTLWWRVSVSHITQLKRVVRSVCARRARVAFELALKEKGFDRLGRPLLSTYSWLPQDPLTGSVDLIIRPSFVKQSFETVQHDARLVLEGLLKQRALHNQIAHPRSETPPGMESA
ncbi:hypothetical protein N7523_006610 [Penicillium sp. IBT 18751x]|nr:hypothetical protein N7523_006610 [Penicillium sp. IBT 18751x]